MNTPSHKNDAFFNLKNSRFFTNFVIGIGDGLVVPFALAAGLTGVGESNRFILTAGIAAVCAGSLAMGIGGYLSNRSVLEQYPQRTKNGNEEAENLRETGINQTKDFFAGIGVDQDVQDQAVKEFTQDKDRWVAFLNKFELGDKNEGTQTATAAAVSIGLSYLFGGTIPLIPYILTDDPLLALKISAALTFVCLFIFGFVRSKVQESNPWKGALQLTLIAALAAFAAFSVSKLFVGH